MRCLWVKTSAHMISSSRTFLWIQVQFCQLKEKLIYLANMVNIDKQTDKHTDRPTNIHAYIHTYIRTHARTHTHTHTRAHTRIHTLDRHTFLHTHERYESTNWHTKCTYKTTDIQIDRLTNRQIYQNNDIKTDIHTTRPNIPKYLNLIQTDYQI